MIKYAVLYNIFICWVVAGMGLLISFRVLGMKDSDLADRSFGYFWLFSAGLWTFSGLRLLALFFGFLMLDAALFYVVQIFVALHLIVGTCFISYRVTKNLNYSHYATLTAAVCCFFFVFMVFFDGIVKTTITPWISEHKISTRAFVFFVLPYLYCVIFTVYAIIQIVLSALMRGRLDRPVFFSILALFVYELAGFFDVRGDIADWALLILRSFYMVAALTAFLSYAWEPTSIRIVRNGDLEKL